MRQFRSLSGSTVASLLVLMLGSIFSAAAVAQTSSTADDAVAYQVNAAHSGSMQLQDFQLPLRRRWSINLQRTVSYPLIADGRVFVTVADSDTRWDATSPAQEKWLYALDATDGHVLWRKPIAGYSRRVNACYEGGRIFVSDDDGALTAYDAVTGNILWSRKVCYSGLNPPTALNGIIYVDGYNSPGAVISAVRASDGAILWSRYPGGGYSIMAAVTPEGVYASFGSYGTYKYDPTTGAQLWRYNSGGWGKIAVFHSGLMFARGVNALTEQGAALSTTGSLVRNFDASPVPAFAGQSGEIALGYFVVYGELQCQIPQTGEVLWRLRPPGQNMWGDPAQFTTAPLVVNDYVFVGSNTQTLYAMNRTTGEIVWSDKIGITLFGPDEWNMSRPVTGFNAGEGLVLIPADNTLIAYEPDSAPVPDTEAPQTEATASGTAGSNGWYRSAVRVTLTASDGDGSGVASTVYTIDGAVQQTYTAPFTVAGDAAHCITFWSVDEAGNTEPVQTLTLKIDATVPALQWGAAQPAANAAGWNNAAVQLPFAASDNLSGVASASAASPLQFSSEGPNQTRSVTVTDMAGNSANFVSPAVNIDLTLPTTVASVSGPTGANGWLRGPATVTLSATDALSSVTATYFAVDGGATQNYTGTFSITGDARHTVRFWSVDAAGNIEAARSREVNIDTTTPMLSVTANPTKIAPAKKNPWATVTVSGRLTDAVSGVDGASVRYTVQDEYGAVQPSGAVTLGSDGNYSFTLQLDAQPKGNDRNGRLYTITVQASDQAGNQAVRSTTVTASK